MIGNNIRGIFNKERSKKKDAPQCASLHGAQAKAVFGYQYTIHKRRRALYLIIIWAVLVSHFTPSVEILSPV